MITLFSDNFSGSGNPDGQSLDNGGGGSLAVHWDSLAGSGQYSEGAGVLTRSGFSGADLLLVNDMTPTADQQKVSINRITGDYDQIVMQYVDANNYYWFSARDFGTGHSAVYKRVSGVDNVIINTGVSSNASRVLSLENDGLGNLTFIDTGNGTFTYDDTASPLGAGKVGIALYAGDVVQNFKFEGSVPSPTPPSVDSLPATSITSFSAQLNGDLTDVGAGSVDEEGFVWGTTSQGDPGDVAPGSAGYDSDFTNSGSFSTGDFSHSAGSLVSSTTYYFRAYAHNAGGYVYGVEETFDTLSASTFRFTNLPGIEFDESDTTTIFAERLNDILDRLDVLE